ncbi:MAG: hypothetical protein EOP86_24980, partial [Verrucomicrobiaceae bacterium]
MAGGNLNTAATAPASNDGSVRLTQSTIGFIAATPQGAPAYRDILATAAAATYEGARYRYQTLPDGSFTADPPVAKTNGVFNISDAAGEKFSPEALDKAAEAWRLAIRMNPVDPEPYRGLIQTFEERLVASAVRANQHYTDSVRFRLLPNSGEVEPGGSGSALDRQRTELFAAREDLLAALSVFSGLASDPLEGHYLLPDAPYGIWPASGASTAPLPAQVSRLFESYVRALAQAIEIEEQIQRLDYFQNYPDPLAGDREPATGGELAAEVRGRAGFYEDYMILAGSYAHVESSAWAPLSRAKTGVETLLSLARDIDGARLVFAPGIRQGGSASDFVQTSFSPHYVPFITAGVTGSTSSRTFDNLLVLAAGPPAGTVSGALGDALSAETEANSAAEEVIQTEDALKTRSAESFIRYNGLLIELCGSFTHPQTGRATPDLQGYLLPPDLRQEYTGRSGSGAVFAQ